MNGKQVVIRIKPDGTIKIEAKGHTGPSCVEAVKKYAEALGVTLETENKPEFYLEASEDAELTIGGGDAW